MSHPTYSEYIYMSLKLQIKIEYMENILYYRTLTIKHANKHPLFPKPHLFLDCHTTTYELTLALKKL